jgi:hypothetical protein
MRLSPAAYAVFVFGGYHALAKAIGVTRAQTHKWATIGYRMQDRGLVPSRHLVAVLRAAKERNLPLTALDLVEGREVPDEAVRESAIGRTIAVMRL